MDLQSQKLELLEWLANINDKDTISALFKWKENSQKTSIAQYNKEIDEANAQIEKGNYMSNEDAKQQIGEWRAK